MPTQLFQTRVEQVKAIQWTGDNLKEVLDFTDKAPNFDDWFDSFEEYEEYVKKHDNMFKLFYLGERSSTTVKVKVGHWIVRHPGGEISSWDEQTFRRKFEMAYDD